MLTITNITFKTHSLFEKRNRFDSDSINNNINISFSGNESFNDVMVKNIKNSQYALSDEISSIFRKDRVIISNDFTGQIIEKDKFSKLGYYLNLKEKKDDKIYDYLKSQNLRILNKEYNDFYNSHLKSYTSVQDGKKRFLDDSLNIQLKNSNIDKTIEKRLDEFFLQKSQERIEKTQNFDYLNTDFAQKRIKAFDSIIKENPLMMPEENLHKVFVLIDKQLENADKSKYNSIYENLDNLSEALYSKNKELLLTSWQKLTDDVKDFYKTDYLREISEQKDSKVKKIDGFIASDNYKILNNKSNLLMLFEYRGSGELSLSEKEFLIDKYQQAQKDKKSYGIDMLDFLVEKPANNKIRKQIVKNLAESQEFAKENFDELKLLFVDCVNNKDYESAVFNIKIGTKNLSDIVLQELNIDTYNMSQKNKVDYLSKIADEDLSKIVEKSRKSWMDEKFIDALNLESDKYDMAKQTENILKNITLEVDGKTVGINEFVDESFQNLFGQNADLKKLSEESIKQILINKKLIMENTEQGKKEYNCLMNQMTSLMQTLSNHDKKSELFHMQISKELDKIEMNCPWLQPQVKDTRNAFQKVKDGLLNMNSVMSGTFLFKSLTLLMSTGEPISATISASLMAILYGGNIIKNIKNEFKKG